MKNFTQQQKQQILKLKQQGLGVTQIGRQLIIDRRRISKFLKQQGISTERNPIKKDIFNKIDTEEKAYWLGMLYSDGSINSIHGQVELGLQESDYQHLIKLKNFLGCNNKISYSEKTKSYRLSFCCSQITKALIKLGCVPKKSLILTFPSNEQVPPHLKKHFMRGYIDGDGCLCHTDKTYYLGFTSTKEFIEQAIKFFNWRNNKITPSGKAYTWRCADKLLVPIYLTTLYKDATIYLDRKYQKYKQMTMPFIKEI